MHRVSHASFPDCQAPPLPDAAAQARLGSLAWAELEEVALEGVAEELVAGRALGRADAVALGRASLPLLGKLVEVCGHRVPDLATLSAAGLICCDSTSGQIVPLEGQPPALTWERFVDGLLMRREAQASTPGPVPWYPDVEGVLDGSPMANRMLSAWDVLRAIALARLLLPAAVEIVAPLTTLGAKVAQVALHYGANRLGYLATDSSSSSGAAEMAQLAELLRACVATPAQENPQLDDQRKTKNPQMS